MIFLSIEERAKLTLPLQYNETINDLLGTGEIDKKKHEIKHEKGGKTTVTDIVVRTSLSFLPLIYH
jgi:hypothetical protein